jgi:hypothetical protein
MKNLTSEQDTNLQGKNDNFEEIREITQNQEVDPLGDEYPFTLDLVFNRRKPRWAALISLLVPGFGGGGATTAWPGGQGWFVNSRGMDHRDAIRLYF